MNPLTAQASTKTPFLLQEDIPSVTFHEFDCFKLKSYAELWTDHLIRGSVVTEGAFVFGLNAQFGAGKSTFLEMWKHYLEEKDHMVIHINAWDTDFGEDPLLAILEAILSTDNDSKTGKAIISAINQFFAKFTGIDPKKAREAADSNPYDSMFSSYRSKKKAYKSLKDALKDYIKSLPHASLIIMVDELDRVRPDYAVKFLEAIKHIFSIKGICFVLAVNREQLKASIQQLYGRIDFEGYYGRFVPAEVTLPNPYRKGVGIFKYVMEKKEKHSFPEEEYYVSGEMLTEQIPLVAEWLDLSPRQIEGLLGTFYPLMVKKGQLNCWHNWQRAVIIMIGLSMRDYDFYNHLGKGIIPPSEAYNYIKSRQGFLTEEMFKSLVTDLLGCCYIPNNEQHTKDVETILPPYRSGETDVTSAVFLHRRYAIPPEASVFQMVYKALEIRKPLVSGMSF